MASYSSALGWATFKRQYLKTQLHTDMRLTFISPVPSSTLRCKLVDALFTETCHEELKNRCAPSCHLEGTKPDDQPPKIKNPRFHGWRGTVAAGIAVAAMVLLINVGILIWISSQYEIQQGTATVYRGACPKMKRISTWSHLGINILSTLLLGASNNAMQCLSSPTREEVDKAHTKGSWLDIGVPGVKNLSRISWHRVLLWSCLSLSSIPLHLL